MFYILCSIFMNKKVNTRYPKAYEHEEMRRTAAINYAIWYYLWRFDKKLLVAFSIDFLWVKNILQAEIRCIRVLIMSMLLWL